MACSCFFETLWHSQKVISVHLIQNLGQKQVIRSGNLKRKKNLFAHEESSWLDKIIKEIYLKRKERARFLNREKEEVVNQLFMLMLRLSI
jgi:hypothetical protein